MVHDVSQLMEEKQNAFFPLGFSILLAVLGEYTGAV